MTPDEQPVAEASVEIVPEPEVQPEPVDVPEPETSVEPGTVVGSRTRRVQYGSSVLDITEGEPVDVPDGLLDSWVEMGWVTVAE